MELKSMKMSQKAKKDSMPSEVSEQEYPYGLCIRLDEDQISKLELPDLPKAGSGMMIVARADVRSVAITDNDDGKKRHLELQITDMSLKQEKEKQSATKVMYGEE